MRNRLVGFILIAALSSGCTITSRVKLYSGAQRETSEIATLYVDPHIVLTRVDDITEHPGDKSRALVHSAGKRHEIVELLPGEHKLVAIFSVLCLRSAGEVNLKFSAEAGKNYRLKSIVDPDFKRWRPEIVEYKGEAVESNVPFAQAMCPVNVTVIRLGR